MVTIIVKIVNQSIDLIWTQFNYIRILKIMFMDIKDAFGDFELLCYCPDEILDFLRLSQKFKDSQRFSDSKRHFDI